MGAIFISYRRDDAEGEAGRLFADLSAQFGADKVFMDVAGIEPGRDFRKIIDQKVSSCAVLLALIGKDWIGAKDAAGQRRLDDPLDFVRLETASALKRDIPVIPVLVHGGRMPRADQLPDDLKDLVYRNQIELTHARWNSDVRLLIEALRPYAGNAEEEVGSVKSKPVADRRSGKAEEATAVGSMSMQPPQSSIRRLRSIAVALVSVIAIVAGGLALYEYRQAKEAAAMEAAAKEAAAKEAAAKEAAAKEAAKSGIVTTKQAVGKETSVKRQSSEAKNMGVTTPTGTDLPPCTPPYSSGPVRPGTRVLFVTSADRSAEGAEVLLDGRCLGMIAREAPGRDAYSAMLVNIPLGTHEVVVRKKGYAEFRKDVQVLSSDQPPERTPKVSVRFELTPNSSSAAPPSSSVGNFAGTWLETNPRDAARPMRLRIIQEGVQITVYLTYTEKFGSPFLEAAISQGKVIRSQRQSCAPPFQKPGYSYDNPGVNTFSFMLHDSTLLFERETQWTSPCDGHPIGLERDSRELQRVSAQ